VNVPFAAGDHLLDEGRRNFAEEEPPQVGSALDAARLAWLDRKAAISQHTPRRRHRRLNRRRDWHAVEPLHQADPQARQIRPPHRHGGRERVLIVMPRRDFE